LENVTDVLSFDYVRQIFADLSESGFDARWEVISAFEVGAPHPRERLWIVANATGGRRIHEKGLKKVQKAQQRRKPNGCTWWETEPEVRRVDDELARGMGRANALLGEGQVPLVVKEAWNRMTDWREK
jgi:DNA (cytosine-5)-methyltransferase 1